MERLTFEGNFCDIAQCRELPCPYNGSCSQRKAWERLKADEDTGLTPEQCAEYGKADREGRYIVLRDAEQEGVKRLRELAEADKDGRLVVLPCKVGDTVWAILDGKKHVCKCIVEFINIGGLCTTVVLCKVNGSREQYGTTAASFSKTVFLTREEAEKALEAMKDVCP